MRTTRPSDRSSDRPSTRSRRAVRGAAAVAVALALGLGAGASPAAAARHDQCATARAVYRANMNEARFWIGAADRLAAAGNTAMANAATAEAYHYMGLAQEALSDMGDHC